jgi:hypothetical protein
MKNVHGVVFSALLLASSAWSHAQQSASTKTNVATGNQSLTFVTGAGAADYVPLWVSPTQLGNSNIFQGGGLIGIGTTAPGATLDVKGTINVSTSYNLGGDPFILGSTATGNAFLGYAVGNSTMTGGSNVAVGYDTFPRNTTGNWNTALGEAAMSVSTTGSDNTGVGAGALEDNTTGNSNTASGYASLINNTTGYANTASGSEALYFNTEGSFNAATGTDALELNTTGIYNTAMGAESLLWNTTGSYNVGVGYAAGVPATDTNVTGSQDTALGYHTVFGTATVSNATAIGANAVVNANNALVLGCIAGVNSCTVTTSVGIATSAPTHLLTLGQGAGAAIADGWTTYSSRRWKTNIQTLSGALAKVEQLRGVSYDLQGNGKHEVGVIAEEVGAVVPELVTWDKNGKDAQGVDYSRLTALLIEATKEQQSLIEQQQKQIDQLTSQVKTIRASLNTNRRPGSEAHTMEAALAAVHP